jgi:hypothetical protein
MANLTNSKKDESPLRWELADHICRVCFARVLKRTTFDHRKIYRCSNCETEQEGPGAHVLCCCGIKVRGNRDAGIRCVPNPRRTPENPAQIIAEQLSQQTPSA